MLSPQAIFKVLVSRALPSGTIDGPEAEAAVRGGRYREPNVLSMIRKSHVLADEGSYFVANNLQTAITGQTTTAYDATKPSLLVQNTFSPNDPLAKSIYLDYLELLNGGTAYSNATSNTGIFWGGVTDVVNRYSSGGSALTIVQPNANYPTPPAGIQVYAGAIVTTTAVAIRTLTGQRLVRLPVSATALTLANVDRFRFNFGGVEMATADAQLQASATVEATTVARSLAAPPVIIGPGQSFLFILNCIAGGAVTAGNFHYDLAGWIR